MVANSQYISMVLMSVMMLALVIMMFPTSYACSKRIAEVLETETSIQDGSFSLAKRPLRSTVEFRHVTFAYPGAPEPILKDVSFETHPGEITAIIGGTGRGKSSILKLIPRLYDPLFGEVLIDGVNAKEYLQTAFKLSESAQAPLVFCSAVCLCQHHFHRDGPLCHRQGHNHPV